MILNYGQMATQPLAQGIQSGLQLGQVIDARRQREAQQAQQQALMQKQQETLQQAAQLYQTGTPDEIAQFSIQNPEAGQLLSQQVGFRNESTKKNMMDSMRQVMSNPENTEQILQNRIAMVEAEGGDATETIQDLEEYRQNPQSYLQTVEKAYAMMDPKGYETYKSIGQAETEMDYKRQSLDLKRLEIQERILDRQARRETDALKRQKLEQDLAATKEEKEKASQQMESDALSAYQTGQDTLNLINEIEQSEGFESYVGAKGATSLFGLKPTPLAGTEAASVAAKIDTLQSKNFMNAIQSMKGLGALSDAEGAKVASAISSLNPDMTEKAFKQSLNTIKNITKRGMEKQRKILGDKLPKEQMSDEDLINKYL